MLLCLLLAALTASGMPHSARAQSESTRSGKILVPVPPGGTSDLVGRLIAETLSEAVGKPIVVENKPGATGRIAAEALKNAAPDGTTLLVAPIALPVFVPLLVKEFRFEPGRDFVPVAQIAEFSYALAVNSDHPARNLQEFLAWAKANPTKAAFGTAAAGSVPHLLGVRLSQSSGVSLEHIPHRGADQVQVELMSGDIAAGIGALSDFIELHRAGKIRIIATSGPTRSPWLPTVATFREQGFAAAEAAGWTGLFAPAGTPKPIVNALSAAIVKSMQLQAVREKYIGMGVEPTGTTPEAFAAIIAADTARWAPLIKAVGFSAE